MSGDPHFRRSEDRNLRRGRKSLFLLPSLFTGANIALGYYAIGQAVQGSATQAWFFDNAAKAIGLAILFDFLDGAIARLTQTDSEFGKQLDSLADVITFGVAPAVLAWQWGFRLLPPFQFDGDLRTRLIQVGAIGTFLFLVAGASRLARFNIQANPQPSNPGRPDRKYFVGMPIPAAAGVIAAVVHFSNGQPVESWWMACIWAGLIFAIAFLMVSRWRYYSLKGVNLRRRQPFRTMVLLAALIAAIWYFSEYVLFVIALLYMLSGVTSRLTFQLRRHSGQQDPEPSEAR